MFHEKTGNLHGIYLRRCFCAARATCPKQKRIQEASVSCFFLLCFGLVGFRFLSTTAEKPRFVIGSRRLSRFERPQGRAIFCPAGRSSALRRGRDAVSRISSAFAPPPSAQKKKGKHRARPAFSQRRTKTTTKSNPPSGSIGVVASPLESSRSFKYLVFKKEKKGLGLFFFLGTSFDFAQALAGEIFRFFFRVVGRTRTARRWLENTWTFFDAPSKCQMDLSAAFRRLGQSSLSPPATCEHNHRPSSSTRFVDTPFVSVCRYRALGLSFELAGPVDRLLCLVVTEL